MKLAARQKASTLSRYAFESNAVIFITPFHFLLSKTLANTFTNVLQKIGLTIFCQTDRKKLFD